MRIIYPAGTKREWFDRNPIVADSNFSATIAPHVSTLRLSYTCPAGKKAFVQTAFVGMMRATVAAPVGEVDWLIQHYDGSQAAIVAMIQTFDNVVGNPHIERVSFNIYLTAGQAIRFYSSDTSTGGTVNYNGQLSVVEFDG